MLNVFPAPVSPIQNSKLLLYPTRHILVEPTVVHLANIMCPSLFACETSPKQEEEIPSSGIVRALEVSSLQ